MTDADKPTAGFKHLSPEQRARIPADLDMAAIDELLGLAPRESWPVVLEALSGPTPPSNRKGDWAMGQRLGSDDPNIQRVLDRVYKKRGPP